MSILIKLYKMDITSFDLRSIEVLDWRKNRDPAKRMQREQVVVARHNQIRSPMYRNLQKLVVLWVAAYADWVGRFDNSALARILLEQRFAQRSIHVAIEFASQEHLAQLLECCFRSEQYSIHASFKKRTMRRRI
jgi:hypothetical protein